MGPAGSGKSTYCAIMQQHLTTLKRPHFVVNCDPAAENFNYECHVDVKQIIDLDDAMEYVDLGPNGGLVFCMDHIVKNMEEKDGLFSVLVLNEIILKTLNCITLFERFIYIKTIEE